MAVPVKVQVPAKQLQAGDTVHLQGLVIAVEPRFGKVKVTFKGARERVFPSAQMVTVLMAKAPVESESFGVL